MTLKQILKQKKPFKRKAWLSVAEVKYSYVGEEFLHHLGTDSLITLCVADVFANDYEVFVPKKRKPKKSS